jgi:hypothetical protein
VPVSPALCNFPLAPWSLDAAHFTPQVPTPLLSSDPGPRPRPPSPAFCISLLVSNLSSAALSLFVARAHPWQSSLGSLRFSNRRTRMLLSVGATLLTDLTTRLLSLSLSFLSLSHTYIHSPRPPPLFWASAPSPSRRHPTRKLLPPSINQRFPLPILGLDRSLALTASAPARPHASSAKIAFSLLLHPDHSSRQRPERKQGRKKKGPNLRHAPFRRPP